LEMGLDRCSAEPPVGQISHAYLVDLILKSARIYLRPHPCVTALPLSLEERAFARVSRMAASGSPFKVRELIPHVEASVGRLSHVQTDAFNRQTRTTGISEIIP
jgi:hypothetical protein